MFQNIFFNIGKRRTNHDDVEDDGNALPKLQMNHLAFITEVANSIQLQISPINEELQMALAQPNTSLSQADLQILHKSLEEIFTNINEIRNRSAQADIIIQEYLGDALKKRLVNDALASGSSLLTLVRELIEAIDELEMQHAAKEFDHYRESAELLKTIQDRLTSLDDKGLGMTPAVSGSRARLAVITDTMCSDIRHAYREIGPLVVGAEAEEEAVSRPPIDKDMLSQADLTVDAIGPAFRTQLLSEIAQLQVLPYERMYRPGRPLGSLDQLDARWSWFRLLLDTADEVLVDLLPNRWHSGRAFYKEFCMRSSRHLLTLLSEVSQTPIVHDIQAHMAVVVKAVKSCLHFQTDMEARLFDGLDINAMGVTLAEDGSTIVVPRVSDVFDDFLGPYVTMERRNMEEHMIRFEAEDEAPTTPAGGHTAHSTAGAGSVDVGAKAAVSVGEPFESSRKMFEFVRASVKRCTAFSRGQALLSLSDELRAVIRQYAINLRHRCPAPLPANATGKGPTYVVSATEELELCRVINTAEYCAEVLPQLETLIKSKIRGELAEKVTFAAQADAFMDAVVHATTVLVGGVIERLEPPLRVMRKTNWAAVTSVGDDSPYVGQIRVILEVAVPRVRSILSGIHFKNWCLKLGTDLLTRFQDNLVKQKKVVPAGAEQMLLDVNGLKTSLLRMHHMGLTSADVKPAIPPSFTSVITAKARQIETILKLVCTDEAILEERFNIMWPEGQPSDLQTILNLKRGVGLETVAQSMKEAVDKVGDHINDKVGMVNLGNSELSTSIDEMAKGTLLGITSVGSSVGEGITSTAKTAFQGFGKVGEGFGKVGEGFGKVGEGFGKVGEGFGKVGEGFGKVGDSMKTLSGSAFKDIKSGLHLPSGPFGTGKRPSTTVTSTSSSAADKSSHSMRSDGSHE